VDKHEPRYRPIKSGCKTGIYGLNYAKFMARLSGNVQLKLPSALN